MEKLYVVIKVDEITGWPYIVGLYNCKKEACGLAEKMNRETAEKASRSEEDWEIWYKYVFTVDSTIDHRRKKGGEKVYVPGILNANDPYDMWLIGAFTNKVEAIKAMRNYCFQKGSRFEKLWKALNEEGWIDGLHIHFYELDA